MVETGSASEYVEHASWIEIKQSAFLNNVTVYRNALDAHLLLGGVLKGNAYGHGFMETLDILHGLVDIIFVISPLDAFKIRKFEKEKELTQRRVIVLGAVSPDEAVRCARRVIEIAVLNDNWTDYVNALKHSEKDHKNAYRPLKVHLHVDTGLGREGFALKNLEQKLELFDNCKNVVKVQGVMSHFANTEDVTEQTYAHEQLTKFEQAYKIINNRLKLPHQLERHISQSSASLILPQSRYDIARIGISLYGLWASSETRLSAKMLLPELPKLQPALSWKCKSQGVRVVPSGEYIGYGCTYRTDREMRTALLPVGYYDGYPRLLSNKGHVLVNGFRCKILGRVMMNHIIVDVTEATSDESQVLATLVGTNGSESITIEQLAEWSQTINYEAVTRIGSHLKRLVID